MIPCWAEGSGFRLTQTPDGRQKRLDDLYEYGKKKGTLTYKEIMERLMDLYIEPDQLDKVLENLEALGVTVINENDPISTEEYSLGDNDRLGALIAKYTHADLLVLLSDIDGLYTADPHTHPEATLIHRVESVTPEIEQLGGGSNSGLGTGGMSAKLTAAKIATGAGVDMVIANGANANVLYDIVDGKDVGTRFVGKNNK